MKKILFAFVCLFINLTATAQTIQIDPYFRGYERGCAVQDKNGQEFLKWLAAIDDRGNLGVQPIFAPQFSQAIGKPSKKDQGDHWLLSIPVKNGSFDGLKVKLMERWIGKDNGIAGFAIVFNEPDSAVNKKFRKKRFTTNEMGSKPSIHKNRIHGKLALVCDTSS